MVGGYGPAYVEPMYGPPIMGMYFWIKIIIKKLIILIKVLLYMVIIVNFFYEFVDIYNLGPPVLGPPVMGNFFKY